jgi:hypothetical protein
MAWRLYDVPIRGFENFKAICDWLGPYGAIWMLSKVKTVAHPWKSNSSKGP